MADRDVHPHLDFAERYGGISADYLNAYTSIARVEMLVDDATSLQSLLETAGPEVGRAHWFGSEISSYYAVGYVTCLEWHARSRIVDLLAHNPSLLEPGDLKSGQVSDKVIVQMIQQGASVARLIGASLNVANLAKYLGVLSRVLAGLGSPRTARDALRSPHGNIVDPVTEEEIAQIAEMFEFRNALVHELGHMVMGHPNIRDVWNPEVAIEHGNLAVRVMRAIEAEISQAAPADFPNRIDTDGLPVSALDYLHAEIGRLEALIDERLSEDGAGDTLLLWRSAVESERLNTERAVDFIDGADFLWFRYLDLRRPLKLKLATARIEFLHALLEDVPAPDPV